MKKGQKFEDNFRKSIDKEDKELFLYRFKDGTANWDSSSNTRFQCHNISDTMIFYKKTLFIIELKSHKGKSLPLSCIRDNQYKEMYAASLKNDVFSLLFVFFSDIGECYAIHIRDILAFKANSDRKSIPLLYLKEKGFKIDSRLLKTNYRFGIKEFLDFYIKNYN